MKEIEGCGTALVTPFTSTNAVDLQSYRKLVRWQVDSGADFLVPCGTTGESVTLTEEEYAKVIRSCIETVSQAVPVVAGAGSNSTRHAVHLARIAEAEGADAILSVSPYYNKPTQEGIFRHFREMAESLKIPLVIYNVPGRTGSNILPQTILQLSQIQNIIAVKEASGDLLQVMDILTNRPAGFRVLSGDDSLALPIVALGGEGVISVASNIIPDDMAQMISLARQGNLAAARELHYRYLDLMNLNFIESNPIPVKYALFRMGWLEEVYRLPLCPLSENNKRKMGKELEKLKLITTHV